MHLIAFSVCLAQQTPRDDPIEGDHGVPDKRKDRS